MTRLMFKALVCVGFLAAAGDGHLVAQVAVEAKAMPAAVTREGVTVHGQQIPPLVERSLRERYGEQMEEENRWVLVERISAMIYDIAPRTPSEPDGAFEPIDFTSVYAAGKEHQEQREKALAALAILEDDGFFDLLDELTQAKHVIRPVQEGDMIGWLIPELGRFRQASRAAAARLHLAAEAGDVAAVTRAFEQNLALGRIMSHEPTLIGHLVGIAITSFALNSMSAYLLKHDPSAAAIRSLQAAMERQLPLLPMTLALEGERLFGLDFARMMYTDPTRSPLEMMYWLEHPDEELDPRAAAIGERLVEAMYGKLATHEEVKGLLEGWYAEWLELARDMSLASLTAAEGYFAEDDLSKRYAVAYLIAPAIERAFESRLAMDTLIAGRRIMVAVELYQRERGRYPASLDALVPEYLEVLPRDPFSDDAFRYRRFKDDEDPKGRGYLLYSVGRDGEDNGGRLHDDGAFKAVYKDGEGFDFVINDINEP